MKVNENVRGATCISNAVFGCVSYVLYVTCHELPMAELIMSFWFGATVVAGAEWKSQKSAPCEGDQVQDIHQNLRRGAQHWRQPKNAKTKREKGGLNIPVEFQIPTPLLHPSQSALRPIYHLWRSKLLIELIKPTKFYHHHYQSSPLG